MLGGALHSVCGMKGGFPREGKAGMGIARLSQKRTTFLQSTGPFTPFGGNRVSRFGLFPCILDAGRTAQLTRPISQAAFWDLEFRPLAVCQVVLNR